MSIHDTMRRQYGLVTLAQATAAGMSRRQIEYRLRSGRWIRLRPGVYAVAGAPPTFEQAALSATLAVGGVAIVSHATAARLWAFRAIEADQLEISTPNDRKVTLPGVTAHRSVLLFDDDIRRRLWIPTTSRARTVIDLSGRLPACQLGPVLDDQLRRGLRLNDVRRCVGRLAPAPGRRPSVIHGLLARRLPGYDPGDSDLETRVLRAIVDAQLPPPRQQYRVRINGRTYRLDLAYPEFKIAIELDGWEPRRDNRTAFDGDRMRGNEIVVGARWTLLRFTSGHSDEYIVETVRQALAVASAA